MATQTLIVDPDWSSKSGAADATVAFGETFDLQINGISQFTGGKIRLVLLSQSVSAEEAVLWTSEVVGEGRPEGSVTISNVTICTKSVYDLLQAQGGKARLYMSVLHILSETQDAHGKWTVNATDYGIAKMQMTLGAYLENPSIPIEYQYEGKTVAELEGFIDERVTLIAAYEVAAQTAKVAAEDAQSAAEKAQEAAETAQEAAEAANTQAQSAKTDAQTAKTQAQNAAIDATNKISVMNNYLTNTMTQTNKAIDAADRAETYKKNAEKAVLSAQSQANKAGASATLAAASETKAKTSETNAAESAQAAEEASEVAVAAKNTATGLVDSINYSFETWSDASIVDGNFIGPAKKDGVQPRLHNRNRDIHGVTGFSGDTYHNARFLLDWSLARSNDSAYLASYMTWEGNRGLGGTNTFVQPLLPANKGTTAGAIPLAIPCFENSPLYWSGWFMFNDASNPAQSAVKQILLDWSKVSAGGQGTIALMSDLENVRDPELADRVEELETEGGIVHRRDVFAEARAALGLSYTSMSLRQLITTDKGYLVGMLMYATATVYYFALNADGELLASSSRGGYTEESSPVLNNIIFETLNGVYILTATRRVLHLVETEEGASFVEEGVIDLNGVVSSFVPNCIQSRVGTLSFTEFDENNVATQVLAIINGNVVVDLISRKVVQVLGYDVVQVSVNKALVGDTVNVCSSTILFDATVDNGLISLTEKRTAASGNTISFVDNKGFAINYLQTGSSKTEPSVFTWERATGYKLDSRSTAFVQSQLFAARSGKAVCINFDASITIVRSQINDALYGFLYAIPIARAYSVVDQNYPGFLGVDDKGVWVADRATKLSGGGIVPTTPLIRINWEDIP